MSFMLCLSSIVWSLCLVYSRESLDCKDAVNKTGIQCCDPMCYDNEISSECEMSCPKNFNMSESTGNIYCSLQGRIIPDRNGKQDRSSILVFLCIHCDEVCNTTIAMPHLSNETFDSKLVIIAVSFSVSSLLVSFIIVLVCLYHRVQRRRRKQLQDLKKSSERPDDIQHDNRTSTSDRQSQSSVDTCESYSSSYRVSSDTTRTSTVTYESCASCASLRESGEIVKEISGVLHATNDSVKNTSFELPRGSSMLYPHGHVECSYKQESKTNKAKSDIENENESIQKDEKVTLCKNKNFSANDIRKMVAIQPDKIIANEIETVTAVGTTNITIGTVHNLSLLSNSETVNK